MLYKFKEFSKIHENHVEKTFTEKVEENAAFKDIIKHALTLAFENNIEDVSDENSLTNWINEKINFDGASIVDLDFDEKLDLCIYYGEITGDEKTVPANTEWDSLYEVTSNVAVKGIYTLTDYFILNFVNELNTFITDNNLEYSNVSSHEKYGNNAPSKVEHLENGEVFQYRNLDEDFNVDEFVFTDNVLMITLYITKRV